MKPKFTIHVPNNGVTGLFDVASLVCSDGVTLILQAAGDVKVRFQPAYTEDTAKEYELVSGRCYYFHAADLVQASQIQFHEHGGASKDGLVTVFEGYGYD